MLRHVFHQIDWVFRCNKEAGTNRKEPIYIENMGQGYGAWSTQKTVLSWDLDTISHLLRLPPSRIKWRSHLRPSLGRRALPPCTSATNSWGCCAESPCLLMDQEACSHECNMPSK